MRAPWNVYRLWNRVAIGAAFVMVGALVLANSGPPALHAFAIAAMLLCIVAFAAAIVGLRSFGCPRCGKTFFVRSRWSGFWSFSGRCVHCELPLYGE